MVSLYLYSTHNEASKIKNSFIDNRNATLNTLRSEKNKEIPGFPKTIFDLDCLSCKMKLISICLCSTVLMQGSISTIVHLSRAWLHSYHRCEQQVLGDRPPKDSPFSPWY